MFTEQVLIEKIRNIHLPPKKHTTKRTRYYDTMVTDDIIIDNIKEIFLAQNEGIDFLKILFYTWYASGPCDVSQTIYQTTKFYIFDNPEWSELSADEFLGLSSAKDLKWEQAKIDTN